MELLKKLIYSYFKAGVSEDKHSEKNRKIVIVNLFGFVGMFITGSMGIIATVNKDYSLALILFIASFVYYLGRLVQKITKNYHLSSSIILYSLYVLMFYLIHDGGVNNTGPLWLFMVAPVSLFFGGLKKGLFDLFVFLVVICTLLFSPNEVLLATTYETDFKIRLILSFLSVTFLSAFYEYSRQQSFQYMQEMSHKYEQLSKIDPLTQLSNRRDAVAKIEYEQRKIDRNHTEIGIILCDIDHFKQVNDQYGHEAGDKALVAIAQFFKTHVRNQDTVARWGGEEFLFILPDTSAEQANHFAHKLHDLMQGFAINHNEETIEISVCMGISAVNENTNLEQAISAADNLLYKAKSSGRNKVFFDNKVQLPNSEQIANL